MPGVLSTNSTLIQPHKQLPYNWTNNVTQCHIQNGSSWPARFSDELPATDTDSLFHRTLPRLSALAHAYYTILVAAQPSLPFSEGMISLSENSAGIKNLWWANYSYLLV